MASKQGREVARTRRTLRVILYPVLWMVAGASLEFLVFVVIGMRQDHVTLQNDNRCKEDLVAIHAMVDDTFKKLSLDESKFPGIQNKITLMQNTCTNQDVKSAEAIGIDIAMTLSFLSDSAQVKHAPKHE
ncbi:hypothetical protein [Acidisoma cladoniae]|jgi:hypothetical protein|uniref:hypothetical protein n=1 Tax=Acidisoma cladoniae TaxID=3040935 RepID=UPI00254F94A2|nr:hypothetical protein [Acidisoma sp. PAMC 29798]